MKKSIFRLITLILLSVGATTQAQTTKEQNNEQKELVKATSKESNYKASKAASKEAKHLSKEGWMAAPGTPSLEQQLDKIYLMQTQHDPDGFPLYIIAKGLGKAQNYDTAKMKALEMARFDLAAQILIDVRAMIENSVINEQLSETNAATLTPCIMTSRSHISQNIGRVMTVMEIYRTVNGKKELSVRIAYQQEKAKDAVKNAIKQNLSQQSDPQQPDLDSLLDW